MNAKREISMGVTAQHILLSNLYRRLHVIPDLESTRSDIGRRGNTLQ